MSMKVKEASVVFSTRGQVVIPRHIRKDFGIEEGSRALVYAVEDGIILKPITRKYIKSFRGIFKAKPGGKPATQELLDDRAEELRREELKVEKRRT
jgi:AbrB family looped-hinge helix DNA binding protein